MKKERILITDSNALVHRGFHALPELKSPDGKLVNAVYGFFLVFLKAVGDLEPGYVCAAFDLAKPTFRHKKFEDYKAQRPKTPEDLSDQIPLVKDVLREFGVPIFEKEGFEADDVIATIARKKEVEAMESVIVTGDRDTLQLVDENTKVYALGRGVKDAVLFDEDRFRERYGFSPRLMADFKALMGDPSDNIPGIKGVGKKTAARLVKRFGSIENIYGNLPEVKERVRKKLEKGKKKAFFSKELIILKEDVPLDFDLEKCGWGNYDKERVEEKMRELGFKSLLARLPGNLKKQKNLFS